MKVLYDHQIFEAQQYGGVSRYFYELISRAARGHDVDVSLFMGFHINRYGLERVRKDCRTFFGVRRRVDKRLNRVTGPANVAGFAAFGTLARPDIYHPTFYGDQRARVRGKRVLTVYDMIQERYAADTPAGQRAAALKKAAVAKADQIIAISHSTKRDVVELLGVAPERVHAIHLANSLTVDVRDGSAVDGPYLLYVAGRDYYKGFNTLLEALSGSAAFSKDLKLVCFGAKPFSDAEHGLIAKAGLTGRVLHMTGEDEQLARMYKHALAFVYPSFYEGFGLSPLEAMHYGCPVIASRSSSIPEVVGEAGVYAEPGDVDDLRAAIERVVTDETLRKDLVSRGTVQERSFSWDRMYEETLKVYAC